MSRADSSSLLSLSASALVGSSTPHPADEPGCLVDLQEFGGKLGNCTLAQHCGMYWWVQRRMLERILSNPAEEGCWGDHEPEALLGEGVHEQEALIGGRDHEKEALLGVRDHEQDGLLGG